MSAFDEKHPSGNPVQESLGSQGSHEISGKESIHEIEDAKVDLEAGHEAPAVWHWRQIIVTTSLAIVYVGSQIPLYFVGGSLQFMAKDYGGSARLPWLPVSYGLALAAICPFCGYLQDIFGKRNISLMGTIVLMIGIIVVATGNRFFVGCIGMGLVGAGAAIGELCALAGTAELVPVNKRGTYLAIVTFFVIPFTPYVLYSQLLGTYATWRWGQWIALMWNVIGFIGIVIFYHPQSQLRDQGKPWKESVKKMDLVGGGTSITGLTLFLVALQAGGFSHSWASAYVLCILLAGLGLIAFFVFWEYKIAKFPMVPREMFAGSSIMGTAFFIAFVAGMNFYSLLNFFPVCFADMYDPSPIAVGMKGLGPGLATTFGATLVNWLLSVFKGRNKELLLGSCIIMTGFGGALATLTPDTPHLVFVFGILCAFGVGGVLVPAATIAVTVSPDTLIATTVALALSIRVVGGSIGYTIYYNVFINKLTPALPALVGEYAVKAGLPVTSAVEFVTAYFTAPENLTNVAGVNAAVLEGAAIGSRWAYAHALKYVWITSVPFGVLACVACLFLGDIGAYMTDHVAAVNKRSAKH